MYICTGTNLNTYLEVNVQSHVVVPHLNEPVSSSCQVLAVTAHSQT